MDVLSHTLDKVRYFRHLLWGEEYQVRIILGKESVKPFLEFALEGVKGQLVNQLILMDYGVPPFLAIKGPTRKTPPILVYIRNSYDAFVKAIENEYSCEIITFDKDPTLEA